MDIPAPIATILVGLISGLLLLYVHRLNAYRSAVAKFRFAFAPALARLESARRHGSTHDVPDVDGLLREQFEVHAAAFHEFLPCVRRVRHAAYQKAWDEYCEIVRAGTASPVFMASGINDRDPWSVIEEKFHAILRFAKT